VAADGTVYYVTGGNTFQMAVPGSPTTSTPVSLGPTRASHLVALALDPLGRIILADAGNGAFRLWRVSLPNYFEVLLSLDGRPSRVAVDPATSTIYVVLDGTRVSRVTADRQLVRVAGSGVDGAPVTGGAATDSPMRVSSIAVSPEGQILMADASNGFVVKVDGDAGNLYVSDLQAERIRRIDGTYGSDVVPDGYPATSGPVWNPTSLAADGAGNLFILVNDYPRLRKIDSGGSYVPLGVDPIALAACGQFNLTALATDSSGAVYIGNDAGVGAQALVCKIDPSGAITFVTGATPDYCTTPSSMAVDGSGNVFFSDTFYDRVRRYSPLP
jgi:DNA-binding beta-propeller fold protein YncE